MQLASRFLGAATQQRKPRGFTGLCSVLPQHQRGLVRRAKNLMR
jgi:hypothetical protein